MRALSKRERVYLGVFVVALLWGLWNFRGSFFAASGEVARDANPHAGLVAAPAGAARPGDATAPASTAEAISPLTAAAERARPEWRSDPFHRAWRNANTVATVVKPKTASSPLRLSAIVIRDRVRYAVINGRVVGEGDTIAGRTVIRVEPSSVILDEKGNEVRLSL